MNASWPIVIACSLLCACASDADPGEVDRGEAGTSGSGSGGSADAGKPSTLPNLSTAGRGGSTGAGGAGSNAACDFIQLRNCVTTAIQQAVECLSVDRTGTFADDRTRCTFPEANGEIQFAAPARAGAQGFQLDFDLTVAGQSCARFAVRDEDAGSDYVEKYELSTADQTVVYWHGFQRKLECNGQSHEFKANDLMACDGSAMLELPMPIVTPMVSSVTFEFPRFGGSLSRVFMCSDP